MSTGQEGTSSKSDRINFLLNRKRKAETADGGAGTSEEKKEGKREKEVDGKEEIKEDEEDPLKKKAKQKLMMEAQRAKERADQMGPQGWLRPKSLATNKQFLRRTLESAARSTKKK